MKSLKLVNNAKFKKWLNELRNTELEKGFYPEDSNNKVAIKLGKIVNLSNRTIIRWFSDEELNISSKALTNIFNSFSNLKYSDLGVKEYDEIDLRKKV